MGLIRHTPTVVRNFFTLVIIVVALNGLFSISYAITAVKKSFGELVDQADFVIVATVSNRQSLQLAEGAIVTDLTMEIRQSVKGDRAAGSSVILRILGGKIGDVELAIDDAPVLQNGETVLLFVRGNMVEMFPFVGVQQGVFYIRPDPSLGDERVFDWRGKPVTEVRDNEVWVDESGTATGAIALDEFIAEIKWRLGP